MSRDPRDLLKRLSEHGRPAGAETVLDRAEMALRGTRATALLAPQRRRVRAWLVASGAAVATILLIGGVALVLRSGGDGAGPPAPVVTTAPSTTQATTSPPPAIPTSVATTVEPATTTTTTTTTTTNPTTTTVAPPTTSPPTTAPAFPGGIPDLGAGWVQVATGVGAPAAAYPGAGVVAFRGESAWASVDGDTWEPAEFVPTHLDPEYGVDVTHVTAGPAGFVAAAGGERGSEVFFSDDGTSWETVSPWSESAYVVGIAAGPPGFVLFGQTAECVGLAAFSPDGRDWVSAASLDGCALTGATWSGDHWIAATATNEGVVSMYRSDDGAVWTPVEIDRPPGDIGTWGLYLAGRDGHLVLLGTDPTTFPAGLALWYSNDDGRTWSEGSIEAQGDTPEGEYQTTELILSDLGYVAVGPIETLTDASPGFILYSSDGVDWTRFTTEDLWFRDVAVVEGRLIGFGYDGVWAWEPGA